MTGKKTIKQKFNEIEDTYLNNRYLDLHQKEFSILNKKVELICAILESQNIQIVENKERLDSFKQTTIGVFINE
jgi:hypothetical protein